MEEYYEGGHSICRNPVIQKMFVFLGVGEKGGTGADIITKGWKDNGWSIPTVEEKNNPDRIEICLKFQGDTTVTTETTTVTTATRGLNKEKLRQMILQYLKNKGGEGAKRDGIYEYIRDVLPSGKTEEQQLRGLGDLLKAMKKEDLIWTDGRNWFEK